jgi:hypothetical protein
VELASHTGWSIYLRAEAAGWCFFLVHLIAVNVSKFFFTMKRSSGQVTLNCWLKKKKLWTTVSLKMLAIVKALFFFNIFKYERSNSQLKLLKLTLFYYDRKKT